MLRLLLGLGGLLTAVFFAWSDDGRSSLLLVAAPLFIGGWLFMKGAEAPDRFHPTRCYFCRSPNIGDDPAASNLNALLGLGSLLFFQQATPEGSATCFKCHDCGKGWSAASASRGGPAGGCISLLFLFSMVSAAIVGLVHSAL